MVPHPQPWIPFMILKGVILDWGSRITAHRLGQINDIRMDIHLIAHEHPVHIP